MMTAKILLLLFVANGAPILLSKWLEDRYAWPVDGGYRLGDGRPLLGSAKTWRGLVGALTVSVPAAWGLGFEPDLGFAVGALAMLGDLFSSFLKRRLDIPSSGMALGLDQIPESLFPLLWIQGNGLLEIAEVPLLTAVFLVLELAVSRMLYWLHIRRQPY
ncbi:MAG: CDP-archaeol synthase [Methylococcaceae bacterium]|nr:CDP-archaeol synthase [Methylococcaceae bacterium]